MKKIKLNSKLSFKKETIATLNKNNMDQVKGGLRWSAGCSDGGFCRTLWNCTEANCTSDCGTLNACQSTDPNHTNWTCTL